MAETSCISSDTATEPEDCDSRREEHQTGHKSSEGPSRQSNRPPPNTQLRKSPPEAVEPSNDPPQIETSSRRKAPPRSAATVVRRASSPLGTTQRPANRIAAGGTETTKKTTSRPVGEIRILRKHPDGQPRVRRPMGFYVPNSQRAATRFGVAKPQNPLPTLVTAPPSRKLRTLSNVQKQTASSRPPVYRDSTEKLSSQNNRARTEENGTLLLPYELVFKGEITHSVLENVFEFGGGGRRRENPSGDVSPPFPPELAPETEMEERAEDEGTVCRRTLPFFPETRRLVLYNSYFT